MRIRDAVVELESASQRIAVSRARVKVDCDINLVANLEQSARPVVVVVAVYQLLIVQTPLRNVGGTGVGSFWPHALIAGMQLGLFSLRNGMAHDFAWMGSIPWLLRCATALGFSNAFKLCGIQLSIAAKSKGL